MSDEQIFQFEIDVSEAEITRLKERVATARWPEAETPADWSQGVPLSYHREFCNYWANDYNWYATQERLNHFNQFKTNIDGLDIHFIHARSTNADARPIIITHGWPGSIVEFHKVIQPLTEPQKHGGMANEQAHNQPDE